MKEDRGHRRRTRQGPCCRDRSCSSRTSRSPPRSCSSRTPCSTPATATVEAAVFSKKHYLCHQGVLCTVQVEKIWLEADSTAEEKDDGPCPWWSNLAQWSRLLGKRHKHSEKWKGTNRVMGKSMIWGKEAASWFVARIWPICSLSLYLMKQVL